MASGSKLDRLLGGHGDNQRVRVRHPDILARADDDPAGNEPDVLAGVEHFGEPVEGCVWIAASHAFDEGTDRVVVLVTGSVVNDGLLLDAFLGGMEVDPDHAIAAGRRGQGGDLQGVQGFSRIPIAEFCKEGGGFRFQCDLQISQTPFLVGQRCLHERGQVILRERLELEDLGS